MNPSFISEERVVSNSIGPVNHPLPMVTAVLYNLSEIVENLKLNRISLTVLKIYALILTGLLQIFCVKGTATRMLKYNLSPKSDLQPYLQNTAQNHCFQLTEKH